MIRKLLFFLLAISACSGGIGGYKESAEEDFAQNTHTALWELGYLDDDPSLTGLVRGMGERIAVSAMKKRNLTYRWDIWDLDLPNAMNAGAGYTFVSTGLLRWAETTDEVAAILGHEAAHTADGHIKEAIGDAMAENLFIVLVAILTDSSTAVDLASALAGLRNLSFGREHENVADRMGALFAWESGFNPHYTTIFFERLVEFEGGRRPSDFEIAFMSHPPTEDRIGRINGLKRTQVLNDPQVALKMANDLMERGFPSEAIVYAQAGRGVDGGESLRRAERLLAGVEKLPPLPQMNRSPVTGTVPLPWLCVNLNTSSAAVLALLEGVSRDLARAIVDYREKNGDFLWKEDVLLVDGVGKALYKKIENHITVESGCPNREGIEKGSWEWEEAHKATIWGSLSSIERMLQVFGEEGLFVGALRRCLDPHRGRLSDEGRWPLATALLGDAPVLSAWPSDEESRVVAIQEDFVEITECSLPHIVAWADIVHRKLENRSMGSGERILWSFFGSEGPVPSDEWVWAAFEEAKGPWGDEGLWITFHLLLGDLIRAWGGPLHAIVPPTTPQTP
ncbi:M48 family metalloprotease [bacterium]|nr:M48 family metalloprotease [bacterium]